MGKAEFQDPVSHRAHVENYKKGIRDSIAFDEQYQKEAEEELKKEGLSEKRIQFEDDGMGFTINGKRFDMREFLGEGGIKMISTIIFCLCLFVGIWFAALTGVRAYYKQNLSIQLLILATAWTGVITHLMHIW